MAQIKIHQKSLVLGVFPLEHNCQLVNGDFGIFHNINQRHKDKSKKHILSSQKDGQNSI